MCLVPSGVQSVHNIDNNLQFREYGDRVWCQHVLPVLHVLGDLDFGHAVLD